MSAPIEHSSTVTDPSDDDACPGCGTTHGVQPQPAPPNVDAWTCTACGMDWAITVVNPHLRPAYLTDLAAAAEEIGRLRWTLRAIITLATDAPQLADVELRERLVALANSTTLVRRPA